jgi:hypothetical protein
MATTSCNHLQDSFNKLGRDLLKVYFLFPGCDFRDHRQKKYVEMIYVKAKQLEKMINTGFSSDTIE